MKSKTTTIFITCCGYPCARPNFNPGEQSSSRGIKEFLPHERWQIRCAKKNDGCTKSHATSRTCLRSSTRTTIYIQSGVLSAVYASATSKRRSHNLCVNPMRIKIIARREHMSRGPLSTTLPLFQPFWIAYRANRSPREVFSLSSSLPK